MNDVIKGKFMEDTGVTISESEMGIYKLSNGKRVCFLDELLLYLLLKKYKKEKGIQKYET